MTSKMKTLRLNIGVLVLLGPLAACLFEAVHGHNPYLLIPAGILVALIAIVHKAD